MIYNLYQVMLSDERIGEVNGQNGGWSGVKWGNAYLDVTSCLGDDNAMEAFVEANIHNLYTHTVTVDVDDPEEAFHVCNLWNDDSKIVNRIKPAKSMSVGDVLMSPDGKVGFICLSCGFLEFTVEDVMEALRNRE